MLDRYIQQRRLILQIQRRETKILRTKRTKGLQTSEKFVGLRIGPIVDQREYSLFTFVSYLFEI